MWWAFAFLWVVIGLTVPGLESLVIFSVVFIILGLDDLSKRR